ncbi:hypothetical protein [Zhihengliuella salsuginis]|uniref:Energy-coupling factor transport system substrate-specific component n=1 Tax=Zhihengliuella salsuginis TaxID=578222 RepID=A0ABQ3GCL7_9MICC|nr:hypothetical protein [Zhihengliuella salsuginis]GHC99460.1 hypothetical protein GCM10008096_01630 [Zhihengliuella salsuginis]
MDPAGHNDDGATAPAPTRAAPGVSEGQRRAFVERILWTFAGGAAVYALLFAFVYGGLGHLVVGQPPALIVTLSIGVFPVLMMLAGYLVAHPVEAYRGAAVIGLILGVLLAVTGFSGGPVHAVVGVGLLLWAFKTREQILVWAGVTSLVLAVANVFLGGFMVPPAYSGSGAEDFGPLFTVSPYWVGLFGAVVLGVMAHYQRRRRARSRG